MDKVLFLKEARERFERAYTAEKDNREQMIEDLEFKAGKQWPGDVETQRKNDNRPMITVNRMGQFVRQVTGDIRQNSPSIKVSPADSGSDPDTAEIYEGLIRHIEHSSTAKVAYNTAADFQATCGYGAFRINLDYEDGKSFNKEIKIQRVRNPFTVYFDPDANELTRKDGKFCFVTETISKKEFEQRYPNAKAVDVDSQQSGETYEHWYGEDEVRIAEYWVVDEKEVEIAQLSNGDVIEKEKATIFDNVVNTRKSTDRTVKQYWISGDDILEGPEEWNIKYIPIIPVYGEEENLEGKTIYHGVVRHAKDPQRLYNYWRTAGAELIALQPKAPYMMTPEQIKGHETRFKNANKANYPYLLFNPDPKNPGPPKREMPPNPPAAMWQEAALASDDMKAATGIYDPSLGAKSNESSGRAILARQRESDSSNFVYIDNLSVAIQHAGRIIVDLIPQVYDTQRTIRILGEDESEKVIQVNRAVMMGNGPGYENDLTTGKYDVRVTTGPSYATKRMEAADTMMQFIQAVPGAAQIAGDLIAKNMDWPGAEEIATRLQKMLPPGIMEMEEDSPEAQQQMMNQQQAAQKQEMAEKMQMQAAEADIRAKDAKALRDEAAASKDLLETMMASGQMQAMIQQLVMEQMQELLQPPPPMFTPIQNEPPPGGFFMPEELPVA